MKIEIEFSDIKTFADGLNNAIIAYANVIAAIQLGCEVPKNLMLLRTLDEQMLKERLDCLVEVYGQVLIIERESKKYEQLRRK